MNTITIEKILSPQNARQSSVRGGFYEVITIQPLTNDQKEYCRLTAIVDFPQLARIAIYMNAGLEFKDAVIKSLKGL
jgi:hypothetical protein